MNNHYAKFEYKEMKNLEVTDYTNQTVSEHFGQKNGATDYTNQAPQSVVDERMGRLMAIFCKIWVG